MWFLVLCQIEYREHKLVKYLVSPNFFLAQTPDLRLIWKPPEYSEDKIHVCLHQGRLSNLLVLEGKNNCHGKGISDPVYSISTTCGHEGFSIPLRFITRQAYLDPFSRSWTGNILAMMILFGLSILILIKTHQYVGRNPDIYFYQCSPRSPSQGHDRKPILADISNAMVGFKDLGGGAIRARRNTWNIFGISQGVSLKFCDIVAIKSLEQTEKAQVGWPDNIGIHLVRGEFTGFIANLEDVSQEEYDPIIEPLGRVRYLYHYQESCPA